MSEPTPETKPEIKSETKSESESHGDTPASDSQAAASASGSASDTGAPVFGAPSPEETAGQTRPGQSGGWIAVLIAVVVVAGIGAAVFPKWRPYLDMLMKQAGETADTQPATPAPAPEPSKPEPPAPAPAEAVQPAPPASPAPEVSVALAPAPAAPAAAPVPGDGRVAAALEALSAKLAALDARLTALEGAPKPEAVDVAPLAGKIAGLQEKFGNFDALIGRLDQLERRAAERAAASPRRLAVAALRDALATGQSYRATLDTLTPLVGDDPQLSAVLASVAGRAGKGVPTVPELASAFETVAADAARLRPVMAGEGWLGKAVNRLAQLVSVRRIGASADGAGDPVDAALARAETALRTGDLAQAIDAVAGLPEPSLGAAKGWLADAHARQAADRARAGLAQVLTPLPAKPASIPLPAKAE